MVSMSVSGSAPESMTRASLSDVSAWYWSSSSAMNRFSVGVIGRDWLGLCRDIGVATVMEVSASDSELDAISEALVECVREESENRLTLGPLTLIGILVQWSGAVGGLVEIAISCLRTGGCGLVGLLPGCTEAVPGC